MARKKKFGVWFCIAIYFLAFESAQGAVLCVGAGGHAHIEMEVAGATACNQASTANPQRFAVPASMAPNFSCDIERCATCEHILLFIGTPEHLPLSLQSMFSADLPILDAPFADAVPTIPGMFDKAGALIRVPTGYPVLALLLSVVLLI